MNKDDVYRSQFRLPYEIYELLKGESENNRRSLNAEVIARLQQSFSPQVSSQSLMPAAKAKEMSARARRGISGVIEKRIIEGISRAVAMGHSMSIIELIDMELEALPEADLNDLLEKVSEWLESEGYEVQWDVPDSLLIKFDDR